MEEVGKLPWVQIPICFQAAFAAGIQRFILTDLARDRHVCLWPTLGIYMGDSHPEMARQDCGP